MTKRKITATELAKRLGVSRMTINRWKKIGRLPPPTEHPGKAAFWTEDQIARWQIYVPILVVLVLAAAAIVLSG
ncbi:MAG: MerR family transcriptional regulator, partial [SAR324 cluster bacterium]|nr:MerR family transcriptional regulator [SAR324 cluster bacterium]